MPELACSKTPRRRPAAPVKAPGSCPKSSLATTPSAKTPQFSATKGLEARPLWSWMARATSSLPVPVSPRIRTGTSVAATRATRARSARMGSLSPRSAGAEGRTSARRRATSARRARISGKPSMSSRTSRTARGWALPTKIAGITWSIRAGRRPACTSTTQMVCDCGVPAERSTSTAHASAGKARRAAAATGPMARKSLP